jgi:hypothetical protein
MDNLRVIDPNSVDPRGRIGPGGKGLVGDDADMFKLTSTIHAYKGDKQSEVPVIFDEIGRVIYHD